MAIQNMHIHSKYSWDSKMEIEDIARILVENGIRYGAITDHVEFDREPLPWVLIKLKIRNLEIDRANELYQGKIKILKAVEISEPHLYPEKVEALNELDLDFIMGSIHFIKKEANPKLATYLYYREMLKMIEAGQIDVVGHMDYIKRYFNTDYDEPEQIKEIMNAIKENNQIIELNTSAKRRCNLDLFPDSQIIECYQSMVGPEIIIGTDAHKSNELLDNLEQADSIIEKLELKPVIYQKRKRIIL